MEHQTIHNTLASPDLFGALEEADKAAFRELFALKGVQQNPEWHPEGDAYQHTVHTVSAAKTPLMRLVMLCHDFGKATTTCIRKGNWSAPAHDKAGVPLAKVFLERNGFDEKTVAQVCTLVEHHMVHAHADLSGKAAHKILTALEAVGLDWAVLVEVCRCDIAGRPPLPATFPKAVEEWGQKALAYRKEQEEKAKAPSYLVDGSMLIAWGWKPGRQLGEKLKELHALEDKGILHAGNWEDFL